MRCIVLQHNAFRQRRSLGFQWHDRHWPGNLPDWRRCALGKTRLRLLQPVRRWRRRARARTAERRAAAGGRPSSSRIRARRQRRLSRVRSRRRSRAARGRRLSSLTPARRRRRRIRSVIAHALSAHAAVLAACQRAYSARHARAARWACARMRGRLGALQRPRGLPLQKRPPREDGLAVRPAPTPTRRRLSPLSGPLPTDPSRLCRAREP